MTVVRVGQLEERKRPSLFQTRVTPAIALLVLGAIVALRLWVVETAIVDGESMRPTLEPGDRVLVLQLQPIRRFDVVVMRDPLESGVVVKRVVGLPGDVVSMVPRLVEAAGQERPVGSRLYLDGVPYEEPYAADSVPSAEPPVEVPPGAYFVLGDNRDVSVDSRFFGAVLRRDISGVGVAIIYPVHRVRLLRQSAHPLPTAE